MAEVRRRTSLAPLASPCFVLSLVSLETEGPFVFHGRAGITSIVQWNLRPVIFGVEGCLHQCTPVLAPVVRSHRPHTLIL